MLTILSLFGYSGLVAFRDGLVTIVSLIDYSGLVVEGSAHAAGAACAGSPEWLPGCLRGY